MLSLWDRLFGSLERAAARDTRLGVDDERDPARLSVAQLLQDPFARRLQQRHA